MKITQVRVVPMSDPVPVERRHRTDLGTKVKSDSAIIFVDTDTGLTGMGAALGNPGVVQAIVEHELGPDLVGEDPMFSERIYEKLYNGSRFRPALERGWQQPEPSRRRGMVMEAIAGVDIAVWGRQGAGAGGAGVPGPRRRAPRGAGVRFGRLGAGRRGRGGNGGLCRQGFQCRKNARGGTRRLLHREHRAPRAGRAARHRTGRGVDGGRARLAGRVHRCPAFKGVGRI